MISTNDDEKTITELSLITGIPTETIEKVFLGFQTQFTFKHTKNKSIKIPYIGSFLIRYKYDETTEEGKEAQVDAFFSPHPQVKRLIGQLNDIEKYGDYTKLDTFAILKKQIKQDFRTVITDDDRLETSLQANS